MAEISLWDIYYRYNKVSKIHLEAHIITASDFTQIELELHIGAYFLD